VTRGKRESGTRVSTVVHARYCLAVHKLKILSGQAAAGNGEARSCPRTATACTDMQRHRGSRTAGRFARRAGIATVVSRLVLQACCACMEGGGRGMGGRAREQQSDSAPGPHADEHMCCGATSGMIATVANPLGAGARMKILYHHPRACTRWQRLRMGKQPRHDVYAAARVQRFHCMVGPRCQ